MSMSLFLDRTEQRFFLTLSAAKRGLSEASDDVKYIWCCVQIQQVPVDVVFVHVSQSLGGGVPQRMEPPYGSIETEEKAKVVDPHWFQCGSGS